MAEQEFKPYDSNDEYRYVGARLTKDPEVRHTTNGKMVRLQFVSTSRNKGKNDIEDLWIEVNVADFYADAASFLKRGDVLHEVKGKPYLRRFGENKSMFSFCLERAQIIIPSELKKVLKERGWSGSATISGSWASQMAAGSSSGQTGRGATRRTPRVIEELPED